MMNNIKLLYNVFKTMKDKDVFKGALNVEVIKNGEKALSLNKEFETNTLTGDAVVKLNTEANIDGNRVKSENSMEFNIRDSKHHKFHEMHHHIMHKHHGIGVDGNDDGCGHFGIKQGLGRITFILNILNNLKSEEKENGILLNLDLKDIIKEVKASKAEGCKEISESEKVHGHHEFIKKFFSEEYEEAYLNVWINKNNEVEKAVVFAKGIEDTNFNAVLNLLW